MKYTYCYQYQFMSRHHKKNIKKKSKNKTSNQAHDVDEQIEKQLRMPIVQAPQAKLSLSNLNQTSLKLCSSQSSILKKSRVPYYLILHSQVIEAERLGIKDEAKKIKKVFLDVEQQAERFSIHLRRSIYYPSVFLQFKRASLETKEYVFLRDIIKCSKDIFKESKQKIHCIYSCLFEIVPPQFIRLAIFGILKAKDLKVKVNYKFKKDHEGSDLALYYTWDRSKRDINFALIDKNMTIIDFSGSHIFGYQDHKEQINLYEEFLQYLNTSGPTILELDQMQQQSPIFNVISQESQAEIRAKLHYYLQKDLRLYEDQCLQKEQQILNLWADNNSEDDINFIRKLNEDITYMRLGIQNYAQVVIEISQKIKNKSHSNYQYNAFLKRLMMAEKQIQSKLPILTKKEQICEMIRNQSIILIEGETGSGKSTQIPQILCQYFQLFQNPTSKPVLVSQPRRLATRTLAERVASELGERLGKFVDYKTSFDKQVSSQAKIIFKLDRIVLDQLTDDRLLSSYSCLVIDQAHERTISIDVIAGLIKDLVKKRPEFKVIITSASMDVELFERYFDNIKALRVSGRLYDVNVQYRETEGNSTLQKIKRVLNQEIIEQNNSLMDPYSGHVLVFCHGLDEINDLTQYYQSYLNPNRFEVYPLHGKILPEEQRKAFNPTKKHKIIFSSRIAETAITIDDVRVVVDPGEDYELVYNQKFKYSSMKLRQISQSSAKQRAGRAGRTAPGYCFRLYSIQSFRSRPLGKVPEMENSSLDTVVLRLKSLGIENLFTFSYISPPEKHGIQASIETLKLIQALDKHSEITAIGEILLLIPIEPMLGRSLVEAVFIQKVLSDQGFVRDNMKELSEEEKAKFAKDSIRKSIVQILSMVINSSSLFNISDESKNESNLNRFINFPLRDGDFFLLKSFYEQYKLIYQTLGERSQMNFWLKHFFLNKKALRQVRELEMDITRLVIDYIRLDFQQLENQMTEVKYKLRYCKTYNDILLLSLVTSFIPNLCRYSGNPQIGYTLISQRKPIQIYGSSSLSLLGLTENSPSWILAYDLYTSQKGRFYCKIAQEIDIDFLEKVVGNYAWDKFGIKDAKLTNPYYQKVQEQSLPTKLYSFIKKQYIQRQRSKKEPNIVFDHCTLLFDDENNKITVFALKDVLSMQGLKIDQQYRSYLQQVQKQFREGGFIHAYLGTTKATFTNNFTISNIEKVIQSDIVISQLNPEQYKILKEYLRKHTGINVFSRSNWIRIQIQHQIMKKTFQNQFNSFVYQTFNQGQLQIRKIPRNERKISQSKVLLIFKVENILFNMGQKNVEKYYNLLKQIINGEKSQNTLKRPQQWKQDIQNLLIRVNVKPQQCAINIWKNQTSFRRKNPFVEIFAQISNIEGGVYKKLMQLQNANEYLACQSLYIKEMFEQVLAFPSEKVFTSLKEQFIALVISLKAEYKGFNIVDKYMRISKKFKVKIIGKSWAREDLWDASQRIGALFNPLHIILSERQTFFLHHIDKFVILQKLEHEYKYKIALQFDNNRLYVYCQADIYEEIVYKLKAHLNTSKDLTREISYKNKSLEDMTNLIDARKEFLVNNTLNENKIEYEIKFDKRLIILTATQRQHDILRAEFQRMNHSVKHQCIICNSRVCNAYKLLNCQHFACKSCISGHLQQSFTDDNSPIFCPYPQCNKSINIYDIQTLVGQDKFEKWCDKRTVKHIKTALKLETCLRCQLVIWDNTLREHGCHFCGYFEETKLDKL